MNKKIIWEYFKGKGFTDCGVAGLMGNIKAESNFNPKNLQQAYEKKFNMNDDEYTKAVDNGTYTNFVKDSAGYGLAQWTYWSRKQSLLNYAKKHKKSIGDIHMQLDYMYKELKNYPAVLKILETADTVKKASDIVLLQYERPADQSEKALAKRTSYGEVILKEFTTTTTKKSYRDYAMIALDVIEGKYGNGSVRVENLKKNGYDPAKVQRIVNALLT